MGIEQGEIMLVGASDSYLLALPPNKDMRIFSQESRQKMSESARERMKNITDATRHRMSISAKRRCTPEWRKAKSDMYSTKLPLDELRELYESGATQDELALFYGVTQKVIWGFMKRHNIPRRIAAIRVQNGENNSSWKGTNASYKAFHLRVSSIRGKPKKCDECGTTTGTQKSFHWANLSGHFDDINDYKRMCASCHSTFDKKVLHIKWMRDYYKQRGGVGGDADV